MDKPKAQETKQSDVHVLSSLRKATPVSGEAGQYFFNDLNRTELPIKHSSQITGCQLNSGNHAENLTFDIHDRFAKPQSDGAALLKEKKNFLRIKYRCMQCSSAAIMRNKISWKNNIKIS